MNHFTSPRPKAELLAPAGTPEKLDFALHYGADAVYLADARYGLRAGAGNFTVEQIGEAVRKVHDAGKRVYVAINIFAHDRDLVALPAYLEQLQQVGVDALIVTDPGVIRLARIYAPQIPLTLSTQANTLNAESARFWYESGIRRVVVARELSAADIAHIHAQVPEMELEAFVHGSVCIAYSGRCFISNYMTGRDANKGNCTNSCRWGYALQEQKRPDEYFPLEEDARGTYFFNSKDLNMLSGIPRLIAAGVRSFKIEGRGKSIHYLASAVATYRAAIDAALATPQMFRVADEWQGELAKIPNRGYTTGFLDGTPGPAAYAPDLRNESGGYDLVAIIGQTEPGRGLFVSVKNRLAVGEVVEVLTPTGVRLLSIEKMFDDEGNPVELRQPGYSVWFPTDLGLQQFDLLRRPKRGVIEITAG